MSSVCSARSSEPSSGRGRRADGAEGSTRLLSSPHPPKSDVGVRIGPLRLLGRRLVGRRLFGGVSSTVVSSEAAESSSPPPQPAATSARASTSIGQPAHRARSYPRARRDARRRSRRSVVAAHAVRELQHIVALVLEDEVVDVLARPRSASTRSRDSRSTTRGSFWPWMTSSGQRDVLDVRASVSGRRGSRGRSPGSPTASAKYGFQVSGMRSHEREQVVRAEHVDGRAPQLGVAAASVSVM